MATKIKKKVARKSAGVSKAPAGRRGTKERVKTYRVLHNGMRVGYSVRNAGDFMPEARTLPTLQTLLNVNYIEECWVDQEEFDAWKEDQARRDAELAAEMGVDEDEDDDEDEDEAPAKVARKKVAKKTVKKGKTRARSELSEESV